MTSDSNDLSPYELARLERIKRNEERLRSLGLIGNNTLLKPATAKPSNKNAMQKESRRRPKRKTPTVPTRSSKRLKGLKEVIKIKDGEIIDNDETKYNDLVEENNSTISIPEDEEDEKVNYDVMPREPEQLDDQEFQAYVALRAWRLRRKNELEIEPYKICQNRTLCELIRRKRNEAGFASGQISEGDTTDIVNNESLHETVVEEALLSVWGIGPSKAAKDGFGWEMLDVLSSDENVRHLELSRQMKSRNRLK